MLAAYPTRRAHSPLGYVILGGMQGGAWRALGAITPQQAADQVSPAGSSLLQRIKGGTVADAAAGQLLNASGVPSYQPGTADCAAAAGATGPSNVQLAQMGGGLALTGINIAAATSARVGAAIGKALGPATLGISAVIGLFPLLFGHHAAAVRKEQTVLCSAVPAANNYLKIIDQAVQSGQATPQQGIAALQSLQADFDSAVSSIRQDCNAACVMSTQLKAIVLYKSSVYQDLAAAAAKAAPPATSSSGPVTAPVVASGSTLQIPQPQPAAAPAGPNWLGIAALVAAGFIVARFV